MDRKIFDAILEVQEAVRDDPQYQSLLREQHSRNDRFLRQLESMSPEQRDTVMDYCGLLIEMHLRTLAFVLEQR